MKFKFTLSALLLAVSSTSFAFDIVSMSVSQRKNQFNSFATVAELKVTANEDVVEINDIIVNRGNCQIRASLNNNLQMVVQKERRIPFGESTIYQLNNCNVREVTLETNYGTQTYTFR